jgi:hypothetical protein
MTSSNVQQLEPLTLKTALRYAAMGWPVLPLVPNRKVPATAHGVHDATTDAERIRRWWTENPAYNVGIAAGKESGLVVFDVDPRNGGLDGWDEWKKLAGPHEDGATQLTAGGGYHYLALYDPAIMSCKLEQGVDLLSDGKYFVAYPSTINGKRYEWEASDDPLEGVAPFRIPQPWLDQYLNRSKKKISSDSELIKGNRNDGLTAVAGAMRRHGLGEREILAALEVCNETRCDPPLLSSEVARIARSVARYTPEEDTAADVALGSQIAEALLGTKAFAPPANDWIVKADDFSAQPAAINWWVKMWVQKRALMMVHGPSGGGKTFVTLDWLLHIAAGRPEWAGLKVKKGTVLYLAGEGHAGLRARIAAWKHHHQVADVDFYLSTDAIDLNRPDGLRRVIEAVEALGFIPDIIAVDTVHRHMEGDENSAADTKTFIDACDALINHFNATVLLVHHTGNSEDAQHRARGSSAWRGALDIEISVAPPKKKGGAIKIIQRKSKDAELAPHVCIELKGVKIPGWFDDEGEQISSAVPIITECDGAEDEDGPSRKVLNAIKTITEAWHSTGEERLDGKPYITRGSLKDFIINNKGKTEGTATKYLQASNKRDLIGLLIDADIVKEADNGFVIVDQSLINQINLGSR